METPNIIATTLKRKLSLEGSESEILVDAESTEQKIAAEASDSGDEIAVPPSPTAVPSATAAVPSTSWFGWLPSLDYFSSSNPTPVPEEQRQQQILERQALETAVLNAQQGSDDDFVPVEAHLLPEQELKAQQEATRALEAQQLQQAQELKAQQEAARVLEAQQLQQAEELKAQEEAARALEAQQLQQAQELKAQQEAAETASSSIWNLYGLLGSASPTPAQTEQEAATIVPGSEANASDTPNMLTDVAFVSYVFNTTPPPSSAPIYPEPEPHPGAELAMQTADEAAAQFAADEAATQLSTNATPPTTLAAMPFTTPQPAQTDTQIGETKEENEGAVFDAAADALLETKLSEEAIQAQAEERIRMEAEAQEVARIRMQEEQAQREREEKARQEVLRAAAEEQARIAREARARQNAILLQQQQHQQMLLQRQLVEQQRLEQERQREAQAATERREAEARRAFARSCSSGMPTLELHIAAVKAAGTAAGL